MLSVAMKYWIKCLFLSVSLIKTFADTIIWVIDFNILN